MDHKEYPHGAEVQESEIAIKDSELDRKATVDIDNYHGITLKIALVTLVWLRKFVEPAKAKSRQIINLYNFAEIGALVSVGAVRY